MILSKEVIATLAGSLVTGIILIGVNYFSQMHIHKLKTLEDIRNEKKETYELCQEYYEALKLSFILPENKFDLGNKYLILQIKMSLYGSKKVNDILKKLNEYLKRNTKNNDKGFVYFTIDDDISNIFNDLLKVMRKELDIKD